ncbi:UNVERIFIED_CONTAM: hypothetical protein PYX00_002418 [Menopon gallinae]|uniref:RRM domain-containing protein n=1 Tax=Menopon gallinae TaxID=328185 RepID=A0AAW2IH14_9NEOP
MEFVPVQKVSPKQKRGKLKKVNVLSSKKKKSSDQDSNLKLVKEGKPVKKTKSKCSLKSHKKSVSETNLLDNTEIQKKQEKKIFPNRLFVNMKKKIMNDECVKELHPDIVSVTFPRKKLSRWCWAVFESKAKAKAALKDLESRTDVIVRQPQAEAKKSIAKKIKLKKVKEKKLVKTELLKSWI